MKAYFEKIERNVSDVVVTSEPCGATFTPVIGGGCEDPDME